MSTNNSKLLYIFIALVLVYAIFLLFNTEDDRTFSKELIKFQKDKVDKILLYPKAENQTEIQFTKIDSNWTVSKGNIKSEINPSTAQRIIDEISAIVPTKVASTKKEKWEQYQVTDSSATKIVLLDKENKLLELYLGKFSIRMRKPMPGMPQQMGQQQNNMTGVNYFRVAGGDKTYSCDGMISMSINQKFDNWRNSTIVKANKNDITYISLNSETKNYSIQKAGENWEQTGIELDSLGIDSFLNSISNLRSNKFADDFDENSTNTYKLSLKGNNMNDISLEIFVLEPTNNTDNISVDNPNDDNSKETKNNTEYIIKSSQNQGTYLKLESNRLDFLGL